jgi:CHAT domain-containing protein
MSAANSPTPIVFAVRGQSSGLRGSGLDKRTVDTMDGRGRVTQSVRVGTTRGSGETVQLTARPGLDAVVLHIAHGPALMLHPETARDLMLAQSGVPSAAASRGAALSGTVAVPTQLVWQGLEAEGASRGASRGRLGQALLTGIDIITDLISGPAARYTAAQIAARVDQQVDPGLYRLPPQAFGQPLKGHGQKIAKLDAPTKPGAPLLVLLHGTFSNTQGTFGKLWQHHPSRVRELFAHYDQQVYGFDHPTLGQSPIDNALALARTLPDGARLHLLTHSRGGLVAEVLARACAQPELDARDLSPFKDPAYRQQAQALRALGAELQGRDIRVERVVRVACPARGTLLASKRLDAYVSVLRWSLQLAGIPVVPALVDFLGEVATQRTDPTLLPGLEAMTPQSPLVQWLHDTEARGRDALPGQLRVVAGDIQGDSLTSWVKTLLADAFYWTDNDLVVQTRSMYGGTPRAASGGQASASFVLDRGGEVTHFAYFSNPRTADAVCNALVQDAPSGFLPIGPLSWAGSSSDGLRAGPRPAGLPDAAQRPAVIVLPGILGSHLSVDGQRVWLGWRLIGGLGRIAYRPGATNVQPDGPMGSVYDALTQYLSASHEVIEFSFDWRRPMEEEAQRLAERIDQALSERQASGQPVRLLAHSMGGLVARTVQLERPDVWQRWLERPGSRMLMLGTPNEGSFAPMQVISGDDPLSNTIGGFGMPFQDHRFRQLMAEMPGLMQLQAGLLDSGSGLQRSQRWKDLAEQDMALLTQANRWHSQDVQRNIYRWGVPPQTVLDQAVALRQRLNQQRTEALPSYSDRLLMVLGQASFTPIGFELSANEGLYYLDAPETGDGRVTQDSALLPGVRAWTVPCEHGDLPSHSDAFDAYLDLLERGDTQRLGPVPALRGARAAPVRSRPSRQRTDLARPPVALPEVFRLGTPQPTEAAGATPGAPPALRISVHNGNLRFVSAPLLVGHYGASTLTGTERVVDIFIGGAMSASLAAGLYPEAPGTHQIFLNHRQDPASPYALPRPPNVVVAGMGEEGKLQNADLTHTVRQAVMAWAQRVAETPGEGGAQFDLCATLLGSGGVGVSVATSAQAVVQGVREANERLLAGGWPLVGHLRLIELYLNRATEAWGALQLLAIAAPEHFALTPTVLAGVGALRRPLETGYRGTGHDFISAISTRNDDGEPTITYTLDTQRARSEARVQATQTRLVSELVRRASNEANRDPQIGRTLFQLLVPVEMEANLRGTNELLLELNDGTAPIPWELLDAPQDGRGGPSTPWAIRNKLLRKLRTVQFRGQVSDARREDAVLVIGEPMCDPALYPPLPAARAEAEAVRNALCGPEGLDADRVHALIALDDHLGPDAAAVTNALLARPYRIVHIAGHGEPELLRGDLPPQLRGVVLSDDTFLGPREVEAMRVVPELVFLNCCHLAADPQQLLKGYDRASFAAGVAKQLIRIGVRCVVAAGWAVEDHAANRFAITFYESLLRGDRFMDAVHAARVAAYEASPLGNTWAAYQCYGDPEWVWQPDHRDPHRAPPPVGQAYAGIASPVALTLALETLAVESSTQGADPAKQREKIAHLKGRFGDSWGGMGAVAEAFGVACAAACDLAAAVQWYTQAVAANDGSASVKSSEQLANLRARLAWEALAPTGGQSRSAREQTALITEGRQAIAEAVRVLQALVTVAPTVERESLLGSAHKRLAMLERQAGQRRAEAQAVAQMATHYRRAVELAEQTAHPAFFYPALNLLAAELLAPGRRATALDADLVSRTRAGLMAKRRDDPDFWSVVGLPELGVYEALALGRLAEQLPDLLAAFEDLHRRAGTPLLWASVTDQLDFVLAHRGRGRGAEASAATELQQRLRAYASGA